MRKLSALKKCILLSLLIFAVDQASKIWMIHWIKHKTIKVIPGLNFTLAYNKGAAFGIFADSAGWQRWVFVLIAVVISIVILLWARRLRAKQVWENFSYALVLGGAWGNLFDRIVYGHVVDFIDFYVGTWHWYTFNVADIAICVGAGLLLLLSFRA